MDIFRIFLKGRISRKFACKLTCVAFKNGFADCALIETDVATRAMFAIIRNSSFFFSPSTFCIKPDVRGTDTSLTPPPSSRLPMVGMRKISQFMPHALHFESTGVLKKKKNL
jgi:hypothetical protein